MVVSSGNLTLNDWSIWSNALWYQDFPKKSEVKRDDKLMKEKNKDFDFEKDFKDTLSNFVARLMPNNLNYKDLIGINLDDYEYNDIDIVLIPSIPGRHKFQYIDKFGHRKVASVLQKLGSHIDGKARKLTLTYQTSSVGSLDKKFLSELLSSFIPNFLTTERLKNLGIKKLTKKDSKQVTLFGDLQKTDIADEDDDVIKRVKLIYPTKEYVENSIEGPDASSCLLLSAKIYKKDTFPKEILCKFEAPEDYAYHDGLIPHIKVFIITEEDNSINDDTIIYFGSHNFSPAAWGKYEKDYSQISISNVELGVLVPPMKGKDIIFIKRDR